MIIGFKQGVRPSIRKTKRHFHVKDGSWWLTKLARFVFLFSGASLGLLSSCCAIIIRAILSKIGPAEDLGKIFSLLSCLENAIPIIAVPLLTFIYNSTIESFTGAIYVVQSGVYLIIFTIMVYVYFLLTTVGVSYGELEQDHEQRNDELETDSDRNDRED